MIMKMKMIFNFIGTNPIIVIACITIVILFSYVLWMLSELDKETSSLYKKMSYIESKVFNNTDEIQEMKRKIDVKEIEKVKRGN